MSTANEVALRVLANRSLFTSIAQFSSGVSYFVYQVKQQLVCARENLKNAAAQDVELWQNAVCSGDRRTLEALQVLSETAVLGERVRRMLHGITGYALTHTKDLELLEWIDDDDNFPDEDHMRLTDDEDIALGEQGDVEIVKWVLNREYRLTENVVVGAASKGHLDLVTLLHESISTTLEDQVKFGCKQAVAKAAAANGHLAVVRFVLENRPECTHYVYRRLRHDPMEDAVANGHLNVIKYLLELRQERCSRQTMETAVASSQFEALKMLCEVCDEGTLEGALQLAANLGKVEYVKYLFETVSPDGFKPSFLPKEDLVNMAASKGYLELIKFFHEHDYFRFSALTMHNAAIANHLPIVKFLHENRTEGCKVDTLFGCDKRELPRMLEYLCSNRPMANPVRAIARAKREGRLLLIAKLEHGARTGKKAYTYR